MNELQITEQIVAPILTLNFDELEAQAKQIADTYTSVAITDDTYMSAKADAKKLAGYVNDIEKKRKAIKSQAEAPIKEFDKRCKAIEQILTDAKTAIEGVTVKYDEDRKAERRDKIQKHVDKQVAAAGLRNEYIAMLVEPASLNNLSATLKSLKEEYDAQIISLKNRQDAEDTLTATITATVDAANSKISQQMKYEAFNVEKQAIINRLADPSFTIAEAISEITATINKRADEILEAEENIRKAAIEAERKRQEEAAAAAAAQTTPEEDVPDTIAEAPAVAEAIAPVPEVQQPAPTISPFEQNPFATHTEPKYEGNITLTGTSAAITVVMKVLQETCTAQNVTFTVTSTRQV